jgi:ABC-2 type transport system permease protein
VTARLFWSVLSTEARTRMSYRADFWINAVVTFAAEVVMVWFLWKALYAESARTVVGGYGFDAMVLYSVTVVLLGKLVRGQEFGGGAVSTDIYEGTLSRYLVYPAPYLGFKYAQQAGGMLPSVVHLFLFGALAFLLLPVPAEVRLTPLSVATGVASVLVGNALYFLLSWTVQSVAFWADNVWSLSVAQRLLTGFLGGSMVPLSVFPDAMRETLRWTPFPCFFALPTEAFLGRLTPGDWGFGTAVGLGWCAVFAFLGRLVWRRGDLRYTGVGM